MERRRAGRQYVEFPSLHHIAPEGLCVPSRLPGERVGPLGVLSTCSSSLGSQLPLWLHQTSYERNLGYGVLANGERLGPLVGKDGRSIEDASPQDEKYWTRRKKNNVAAKRSRDARRLKENQITIRAAFLEKENTALRTEVAELRKEVGKCKTIVSKYETKYGPL